MKNKNGDGIAIFWHPFNGVWKQCIRIQKEGVLTCQTGNEVHVRNVNKDGGIDLLPEDKVENPLNPKK